MGEADPKAVFPADLLQCAAAAARQLGDEQQPGSAEQEHAGHLRAGKGLLNQIFAQQADDHRRQRGENQPPAHAGIGFSKGLPSGYAAQEGRRDCGQILPVINQHRHQSAHLHQHIKDKSLLFREMPAEQMRHQHQMAGAGHRDELGQALDKAKDKGLQQRHGGSYIKGI